MFKIKSFLLTTILIANVSAADISVAFEQTVITVDQHAISAAQLNQHAQKKISRRFYHGKPPENEQKTFMLGIAEELVDQYLLAQEAKRRNIKIDTAAIDSAIDAYELSNKDKPGWAEAKHFYVPMQTEQLTQTALVEKLQQRVNQQATLEPDQIELFYRQHPEKFTQPPQIRASIILLSVEANARGFVWQAAVDQAKNIIAKLDNGEKFATLAELHSTDSTADFGGDMGFLHLGMTADRAEKAMEPLEIGQHTEPVMLLEGVAIFKVTDRKPPQLHSFSEVKKRAAELANNTAREQAWLDLKASLRANSKINIDKSNLLFM